MRNVPNEFRVPNSDHSTKWNQNAKSDEYEHITQFRNMSLIDQADNSSNNILHNVITIDYHYYISVGSASYHNLTIGHRHYLFYTRDHHYHQ